MSKYIESDEQYVYTGPSVIEIRDDEGKILVSPTVQEANEDLVSRESSEVQFLDTEGNFGRSGDDIDPYGW